MNFITKLFRVLIPLFNETAGERRGSVGSALAIIALIMSLYVASMEAYVETVAPAPAPIEQPAPAPDVQDEDTDMNDLRDVTDPPELDGQTVALNPVQVAWDDSYSAPLIHRRGSRLGGWAEYVARQRDYRRRGVR